MASVAPLQKLALGDMIKILRISILPFRHFHVVVCGLFVGGLANAQGSPRSSLDVPIVGCYRLTFGTWSVATNLGPARETTVIRLDTVARVPGAPGDLVAERIEPAEVVPSSDIRAKWQRPAFWRREGRDSVVIFLWSTGTEAEAFMGHRSGATLHGVVRRTSDAIPVDPVTKQIRWNAWPFASASAIPTPCP